MFRHHHLLQTEPDARKLFIEPPLVVCRQDKNIKDMYFSGTERSGRFISNTNLFVQKN